MRCTEDRALEELLKATNGDFTQKDLAKLVLHWTKVVVFEELERHALTNPLWNSGRTLSHLTQSCRVSRSEERI